MSNLSDVQDRLSQLSGILNRLKVPLSKEFSILLTSIDTAQEQIKSLADSSDKRSILEKVEKELDEKLGDPKLVDVSSDGAGLKFNLPLKTNFGDGLPNLTTTINSTFSFNDALPNLTFKVGLETGSFVDKFAKPVLENIGKIISPLKPINDVLNTQLPGLDKIGINIKLSDIVKEFAPEEQRDSLSIFFDTLTNVLELVETIRNISSNKNIELGEFTLDSNGLNKESPRLKLLDDLEESLKDFINKAKTIIPGGSGLKFPLLESPSTAFNLLLGNEVDLLDFTIPSFNISAEYKVPPITIIIPPIPIPLEGQFSGGIRLQSGGLKFGFDTYGLKQNKPLEGFYIDSSKPIFTINPFLKATLGIEAYIAKGSVGIKVEGDANFSLSAPNNKFRIATDDFSSFQRPQGNVSLFGTLDARIGPPIRIPWVGRLYKEIPEYEFFRVNLFNFGEDNNSIKDLPPNLATYDATTQNLRLNMGMDIDRGKRNVNRDEINEKFTISSDDTSIVVSAFSQQEKFINVGKVVAFADSGDDTIILDTNISSELSGGSGNDTLRGNSSIDILKGDEGNDDLVGNDGDDLLYGDQGDDTLFGGEGIDSIWGGDGNDTVNGGSQGDFLYGDEGNDFLVGDDGDDLLEGGSGDDALFGGVGNDRLYGGDGYDSLNAGYGDDLLDGGDGLDTVNYDKEDSGSLNGVIVNLSQTENYQILDQYVYDGSGKVVKFSTVKDLIVSSGTALHGLTNKDILKNLENISGTRKFDDVLIGNEGKNYIQGLSGNDILFGNAGDDTLDGGGGEEKDESGLPVDSGIDTVSYRYDLGRVLVDIDKGIAKDGSDGIDSLLNIDNIIGSNFDDILIGNSQINWIYGGMDNDTIEAGGGNDILYGEAGNDRLYGQDGDDTLIGGVGADLLNGGDGDNTASYITAVTGIVANLFNAQANAGDALGDIFISIKHLVGSQYADILIGNGQGNHLWGLDGADYLDGLGGNAILEGGSGNDTYRIDNLDIQIIEQDISTDIDTVNTSIDYALGINLENLNLLDGTTAVIGIGNNLKNTISGNSVNNFLNGEAGDDILFGNLGTDTLVGGDGNDWIMGGAGNDILTGGSGNDMFVYTSITDAGDRIMDFTIGNDQLILTDLMRSIGYRGSNPIAEGFISARQINSGLTSLMIDPDGFASKTFGLVPFILLNNVSASNLLSASTNFVF